LRYASTEHSDIQSQLTAANETHSDDIAKLQKLAKKTSEVEVKLQQENNGRQRDKKEFEVCFHWTF